MNKPQIELIEETFFVHYHAFDASISAKNGILIEKDKIVMGTLPKKHVFPGEPKGYDRIW
jgi:hypothetical protein